MCIPDWISRICIGTEGRYVSAYRIYALELKEGMFQLQPFYHLLRTLAMITNAADKIAPLSHFLCHAVVKYIVYSNSSRLISQIPQHIIQTSHHCVTDICIFLLKNGALWDMGQVYCWICATGLLTSAKRNILLFREWLRCKLIDSYVHNESYL